MSTLETLSDQWLLRGNNVFNNFEVRGGDECVLEIGGDPVITGYVDKARPDTLGNIVLKGRDKTGDLVDCTAGGAKTFLNQNVRTLIGSMADPFGITASGDDGPQVSQFVINPGERIGAAILRLVNNYGVVVTSDKSGNLVVRAAGNPTNPGIAIKEGENIDYAYGEFDDSKRFSEVRAIGQNFDSPGFSSTEQGDSQRTRPDAYLLNGEVNQADTQLTAARLRDFSNGSACKIVAKITTLSYYPAGTGVTVVIPSMGINGDMIIERTDVTFDKETGSVTFTLAPMEKYGGDKLECGFLK